MFRHLTDPGRQHGLARTLDRGRPTSGAVRATRSRPAGRTCSSLIATLLVGIPLLVSASGGGPVHAASAAGPPALDTGTVRFSLVPGGSEARYRLRIRMLGQAPTESVCSTRAVTGDIFLGPDGAVVGDLSTIVVDQRTLQCTAPVRDSMVQSTLDTQNYPTARFAVREAPGLPVPLPLGGQTTFQFVGDQTVRGVTRPATYPTTASFTEQEAHGLASTLLRMSDYGIRAPRIGPLVSVDDDMTVELDFGATISTATGDQDGL